MLPTMELTAASPALGATVREVDLRTPLGAVDLAVLRGELARSSLLHCPGQDLSDAEHVEAVAQFGPVASEGASSTHTSTVLST